MLAASRTLVLVEAFTDDAESRRPSGRGAHHDPGHHRQPDPDQRRASPRLCADSGPLEVEVRDIGWGFGRFRSAVIAARS
jgi:hypothetical protein